METRSKLPAIITTSTHISNILLWLSLAVYFSPALGQLRVPEDIVDFALALLSGHVDVRIEVLMSAWRAASLMTTADFPAFASAVQNS